jgi:hypothetical protein
VLTQCVKTLRAVLMTASGFVRCRDASLLPLAEEAAKAPTAAALTSQKLRRQVSTGSKVITDEEIEAMGKASVLSELDKLCCERNKKLCTALTNWLHRIAEERKMPTLFHPPHCEGSTSAEEGRSLAMMMRHLESGGAGSELAGGYVSISNTLTTDALVCAKCMVHILMHDSRVETVKGGLGEPYQDLLDKLVEAGGKLVVVVITELSGLTDPSRRVGAGDVRAAESIYNEAQACLNFVASCFAAGCVTHHLKTAVEIGKDLCVDCRHSMAVQSSWLQALFSAVMCLMLTTDDDDDEGGTGARILAVKMAQMKAKMNGDEQGAAEAELLLTENDRFYVLLGRCITDVMQILHAHPTASSIQHLGLLTSRMLLRPPFMSKRDIGRIHRAEATVV